MPPDRPLAIEGRAGEIERPPGVRRWPPGVTIALTTSGLARSAGEASGAIRVAMSQPGSRSSRPAQSAIRAGSTKGMSPCRLITTSWRRSGSRVFRAARMRSEPDGSAGSVSTARPPAASTARTISASPAATATGPIAAASACLSTRTIMLTPPISASGLPGRRVAAMRAGMRTIGFMRFPRRPALERRLAGRQLAGCASAGSVSETRAQGQARGFP